MGKVEIIPGIKFLENALCAFFDVFTTQYSADIRTIMVQSQFCIQLPSLKSYSFLYTQILKFEWRPILSP